MSNEVYDFNIGHSTAYAYAKASGDLPEGMTPEEYGELLASYATVGQTAVTAAQTATTKASEAATSATTATNKASEATTAATTATNKAAEAQADADAAALDASQALSAASMATTKATEATTAAATAVSAKDDAVSANTAAQSAKTAAQTAQTGAETAAASVSASAAQIQTNTDDISELKEDFTQMESDGVVPSAEQILTDKGVTDSVPYHYRKTGGDGADREYDQIVGGTVAWNQLIATAQKTFTNSSADTRDYVSFRLAHGSDFVNVASVSAVGIVRVIVAPNFSGTSVLKHSGASQDLNFATNIEIISGHKYYVNVDFLMVDPTTVGGISTQNQMLFDLTAMFGSTIADYIYSLEQTTAGTGVAFFKALFPNDYYPYNAGELISVSGLSEHKMVGFNQWDEQWEVGTINNSTGANINSSSNIRSKGFIPVVPNKQYHVTIPSTGNMTVVYYDANKQAIRSSNIYKIYQGGEFNALDSAFVRFYMENTYGTTYNHDICINLSNLAKNGTYEPYKAHSYPLDSTLTLRGMFKLDANNNLYADGDTYEYTGKVTRNTILRAYQSGDESLANAITDGTNTVVYSANASTEQADPYQHLQQCDPSGTEEYVSTGIVPVGHNSFYPENLRAKVEQLPWNFASLIAPTEATFTATRNYTTGALFIVNNVLYKATSNIANGGTITPNTNCTATTLAEIISALA